MQVSKAFRCTLSPGLRPPEANNLRRWAELHCAQSIVFRNPNGSVVLVGLKDELRTSASFARTIRTALRRMAIDVPLRGRWCTLISVREVLALLSDDQPGVGRNSGVLDVPAGARDVAESDDGVRIVALR